MNNIVVKKAQVESIIDDADGLRIKARTTQDEFKEIDELPYAFPLLPKVFQSVPKVGECVLLLFSQLNNDESGHQAL